jgi:hypothetical protein
MFEADDPMLESSHTSDFAADDGAVINLGDIGGDVITNPELDVDIEYVELDEGDPYEMEPPEDGDQTPEGPPEDGDQTPDDPPEDPPEGQGFGIGTTQYEAPIDLDGILDHPGRGHGDEDDVLEYEGPDLRPAEPWESWVISAFGYEALEHEPADLFAQVFPELTPEMLEGLVWEDLTWEELYEHVLDHTSSIAGGAQGNFWELLVSLASGG